MVVLCHFNNSAALFLEIEEFIHTMFNVISDRKGLLTFTLLLFCFFCISILFFFLTVFHVVRLLHILLCFESFLFIFSASSFCLVIIKKSRYYFIVIVGYINQMIT